MTDDEIERVVVEALLEFLRPPEDPPDPDDEPIDDILRETRLTDLGVLEAQMDPLLDDIEQAIRDAGLTDFELANDDVPADPNITVRQLVACVDAAVNPHGEPAQPDEEA